MKNPGNQQKGDVAPTLEGRLPGINDVQLPDLWQICQLAALVSDRLPENGTEELLREAHNRIRLAVEIWREAGHALDKLNKSILRMDRFGEDFELLVGPLRVGNHSMPRLPKWTQKDGNISQEQYLKDVVGLSKIEDRMRWWRAFLQHYMKSSAINDWLSSLGIEFQTNHQGRDNSPLPEGVLEEALEEALEMQRQNGITAIPDGLKMAVAFRRWRLCMDSPATTSLVPHDTEESAKKGLEAERSKQ